MRAFKLPISVRNPGRLLTAISVRNRIIVLALIPVLGFLTNGITYLVGEHDVGKAFQTVTHSGELADASRDFKSAVTAMRIIVKDFSIHPSENLVMNFQHQQSVAQRSLDTIAISIDARYAASIGVLRTDVAQLNDTFEQLVKGQRKLGFDEDTGLRGNLRDAGNAVERIINENMTWLDPGEARKLMVALLAMRNYEIEYRLNPTELTRQQFLAAFKKFTDTFAGIDGTPAMKVALERQVKAYAYTFAQWIKGFDDVQPLARRDRHRQPEHAAAGR